MTNNFKDGYLFVKSTSNRPNFNRVFCLHDFLQMSAVINRVMALNSICL